MPVLDLTRESRKTMATGKYLSLAEARKLKKLDRFAKEHPTKGSKKEFDSLLARMATAEKPAK